MRKMKLVPAMPVARDAATRSKHVLLARVTLSPTGPANDNRRKAAIELF